MPLPPLSRHVSWGSALLCCSSATRACGDAQELHLYYVLVLFCWLGFPLCDGVAKRGLDRALFTDTDLSYVSYVMQYLGNYRVLLGGTFIITSFIAFSQHRLTAQAVLIGVLAAVVLILCYDLPFDDLLLPPNGDV